MTCHQFSHGLAFPCEGRSEPCPFAEVIATKAPVTIMHLHVDARGNEAFMEISAAPVFDDSGEVAHIIESCRNVTDRKRAEAELEQERICFAR